jgi:Phasin protein
MSAAAAEATNLLKHGLATTLKGTQDYSAKVLEFAQANISAAVEHVTKLSSAKSPMWNFSRSPTSMQSGNSKYLPGRLRNSLQSFRK